MNKNVEKTLKKISSRRLRHTCSSFVVMTKGDRVRGRTLLHTDLGRTSFDP